MLSSKKKKVELFFIIPLLYNPTSRYLVECFGFLVSTVPIVSYVRSNIIGIQIFNCRYLSKIIKLFYNVFYNF